MVLKHGKPADILARVTDSTPAPIVPGLYEHYKGGRYEVLHLARHSETEEALVVYRALYGDPGVWVRPAEMFAGTVDRGDGEIPRFRPVTD